MIEGHRKALLSQVCDVNSDEASDQFKELIAKKLSYRLTSSEIISFSSSILKDAVDQSTFSDDITNKYESTLSCLLEFQKRYIKYYR